MKEQDEDEGAIKTKMKEQDEDEGVRRRWRNMAKMNEQDEDE